MRLKVKVFLSDSKSLCMFLQSIMICNFFYNTVMNGFSQATKLKRKYWWQNIKMMIIIGVVVAVILLIIIIWATSG